MVYDVYLRITTKARDSERPSPSLQQEDIDGKLKSTPTKSQFLKMLVGGGWSSFQIKVCDSILEGILQQLREQNVAGNNKALVGDDDLMETMEWLKKVINLEPKSN